MNDLHYQDGEDRFSESFNPSPNGVSQGKDDTSSALPTPPSKFLVDEMGHLPSTPPRDKEWFDRELKKHTGGYADVPALGKGLQILEPSYVKSDRDRVDDLGNREAPGQTNFHQVIPDSHFWPSLDSLIHYLKNRSQSDYEVNFAYLIKGLENTKANGYDICLTK